jgi:hypothetical protein
MDPKNQRIYTRRSGQLAVMAELLQRGRNVAIPEVDIGEDVLAFEDGKPEVTRLQVKTATAVRQKRSGYFSARVSIPLGQLAEQDDPELHYIFAVRLQGQWVEFVVIRRSELHELWKENEIGSENQKSGELQLTLSFSPGRLTCSGFNLQQYRGAWERLPIFQS